MSSSSTNDSWSSTEEGISAYFFAFASLLALVLVMAKVLHDHRRLASFLPEAGMVLLVGMVAGSLLSLFTPNKSDAPAAQDGSDASDQEDVAQTLLSFSPKVFFVILLPPIIFNSGYHLRRELFFRHLTPIVLLACLGTAISTVVVAVMLEMVKRAGLTGGFEPTFTELLTFGALISATDPVSTLAVFQTKRVDPQLFYLVFGESVMNDAVGLVLFNTFARFAVPDNGVGKVAAGIVIFFVDFVVQFVGSLCLGVLSGLGAALLLKTVDMRQTKLLEICLYVMIMYVPFLMAEILHLSGIVSILFTGIAARRYCVPNLSPETEANADVFFRLFAHLAETSIFLELGLSVFGESGGKIFLWRFIGWALLACLIGRALNVYPIVLSYNAALWRTAGFQSVPTSGTGDLEMTDHVEMTDNPAESTDQASSESPEENSSEQPQSLMASFPEIPVLDPSVRRDQRISPKTAFMLWYSGLRGAVAYACAKMFPDAFGNRQHFIWITMAVVLVTVFLLGGTTELVLGLLKIDTGIDEESYTEARKHDDQITGIVQTLENRYIRRFLVRNEQVPTDESETHGDDDASSPSQDRSEERQPRFSYHEHVDSEEDGVLRQNRPEQQKKKGKRKNSLYDTGRETRRAD